MTRTDSSRPSRGQAETTLPTPVPCLSAYTGPETPAYPMHGPQTFKAPSGAFVFAFTNAQSLPFSGGQ